MEPIALIVDPNPGVARRAEEALAGTAYRVVAIRAADQVAEALDGKELAIGLIAASLPNSSGYDLARTLGERHPAAFLVLVTGGFEVFSQARARQAGVSSHLVKPFSPGTLRSLLFNELGDLLQMADKIPSTATKSELLTADLVEHPGAKTPPVPWPQVDVPPPPIGSQRHAALIPRDPNPPPLVLADPEIIRPELERLVAELLPEVVQSVLRHELVHSPRTREAVETAIAEVLKSNKNGDLG